jgi:hypothetical protein
LGVSCRDYLLEIVLDKSLDFYTRRFALRIASGLRDEALYQFIKANCIAGRSKGEVLREQTRTAHSDEANAQVALYISGCEILIYIKGEGFTSVELQNWTFNFYEGDKLYHESGHIYATSAFD